MILSGLDLFVHIESGLIWFLVDLQISRCESVSCSVGGSHGLLVSGSPDTRHGPQHGMMTLLASKVKACTLWVYSFRFRTPSFMAEWHNHGPKYK